MRKGLILLLAVIMLLCVVACNNDPNIYKYNSTTYLGSWEVNIAPEEGDVDDCIHLFQIEFKSNLTYERVYYIYNAQTKEISIVDGMEGTYTYNYNQNTKVGSIALDGGAVSYYWTEDEGLKRRDTILDQEYILNRPKYIVKKADNQKDIVGLWERSIVNKDNEGKNIVQLDIKSDGTLDIYEVTGVAEPDRLSETVSWKYKDAEVEKTYSRTYSVKWSFGSEIYVSGLSTIGEDLHDNRNRVTRYESLLINDNGASSVVDQMVAVVTYEIYQYGDQMLLAYGGNTYVKVANRIDLSEKYKEIVKDWTVALGVNHLYLRSDGTYSTNYNNLLNYDRQNATGFYTGAYSATYSEVSTGDVVAFDEARYKVEHGGAEPAEGWAAWRTADAAAIEALKVNNDVKLFIGKISFTPDFGFAETFDVFFRILTPKYGAEANWGEPDPDYVMTIRNEDKEGNIVYYDFED